MKQETFDKKGTILKNGPVAVDNEVARPPAPKPEAEIIAKWEGDISQPLVSILCMTYNHAPYIEDAINGFLMQETDFTFEIWIHDDASTDGTSDIVMRYQSEYPSIIKTILQEENQYSKGRRPPRFLRRVFRGKYCAFCEGDDFWISKDKLSRQYASLERNPQAHISIHPAYVLDIVSGIVIKKIDQGNVYCTIDVSKVVESGGQYAPTASYFFKSEEFESMPDWFFEAVDLPFGDFFMEVVIGRDGLVYLPDLYSVYRRNVPGSYTERTENYDDSRVISRLDSIIYYTQKLSRIDSLALYGIEERCERVCINHLKRSIVKDSYFIYSSVISVSKKYNVSLPFYCYVPGTSYYFFLVVKSLVRCVKFLKKNF